MRISFTPSEDYGAHGREHVQGDSLGAVSRADLRWYYFLGSVQVSQSGIEIGPPWGWIPLFDVMYSVRQVMIFAEGGDALGKIDFTENDESIDFELGKDMLHVAPSYLNSEITCTVTEFVTAGAEFIRAELRRVASEYPSLIDNAHVQELARSVALELPG
ncbi:hypothetical protein [Streptomyces sp. NPDC007856]|uniref:hypothetical protein n=1 Tax=Streptomyces sp. NPDC007856 TaxID=3364781 RepID=UPI00367B9E7F